MTPAEGIKAKHALPGARQMERRRTPHPSEASHNNVVVGS